MSITDELRKWLRDGKGSLLAIADRIDAEHEKAMSRAGELLADAEEVRDYNYANWQECKQKVLQGNITIDELSAEIERLKGELEEAKQRGNAAWQEGFDAGFASADDWLGQHEDAMAEHGWVRLPKDADGEYIHFGDVLDQFGTPMTVFAMSDPDPDQGDCMLELITDGISDGAWVRARKMRHHHAPTVEDVLCELLDKVDDDRAGQAEIIAEYAAKLQLREGA